jgi:hypothetical protein
VNFKKKGHSGIWVLNTLILLSCSLALFLSLSRLFSPSIHSIQQIPGNGTDFRLSDPCSCNPLAEANNFGLVAVFILFFFYRAYFPSSKNHSHRNSNLRQFFGAVACVPIISPLKQTILVSSLFLFYFFLLPCLVFELQKPSLSGLESRKVHQSVNLSQISSWFQSMSTPSLGQIGVSLPEL